jgi:hypothetical protein
MGAIDLQKVAVSTAKIIKMLDKLENDMQNINYNKNEDKESFWIIAYLCRVGILDRIENNPWMRMEVPIKIPLGLFKSRKETIGSVFNITIGRLIKLAEDDYTISEGIENILKKGNLFYEIDSQVTEKAKNNI